MYYFPIISLIGGSIAAAFVAVAAAVAAAMDDSDDDEEFWCDYNPKLPVINLHKT